MSAINKFKMEFFLSEFPNTFKTLTFKEIYNNLDYMVLIINFELFLNSLIQILDNLRFLMTIQNLVYNLHY